MPVAWKPIADSFGAIVTDVDLSAPIDKELGGELRRLFFERRVLIFPEQDMSPAAQVAFMSLLSGVIVEPAMAEGATNSVPKNDRFVFISNTDKGTYGPETDEVVFHSDYMFTPAGALQAQSWYNIENEVESRTSYTNMVRAAALLPADLRAKVEDLFVVNALARTPGFRFDSRCRMSRVPDAPHAVHPIIERHPVTGDEFIDVSPLFSSHVLGWDDATSEELFAEIEAAVYKPDNIIHQDWNLNDFVAWDNVAIQHRYVSADREGTRTFRRVIANPYELSALWAGAEAALWQPPTGDIFAA